MPDRTKYDLDSRPSAYWLTPGAVDDVSSPREPDEVVIVSIALASVLGDVICIRARPWGTRIAYSIADEYGTSFRFQPKQSTQPLPMGELIALIDGATGHLGGAAKGLTTAYRDWNADGCDPERLVGFVTVTSAFYAELPAWYEEEAVEWLASVAKGAESDDA